MLIAQLTDCHVRLADDLLNAEIDTGLMLEQAIEALLRLSPRPDVVLLTGDLTDHGLASEYARFEHLLTALPMPWYLIPGNHDSRGPLLDAFAGRGGLPQQPTDSLHYALDLGPLRLVALDTLIEGATHGEVGRAQLNWLEAELASHASHQPVLLMLHHPPFITGLGGMDRINCRDGATLAQVVAPHAARIERVLCGHCHRAITRRWAGTLASIAPATAHQIALTLDGQRAAMCLDPPGFQLHLWCDEGLSSHIGFVAPGRIEAFGDDPRYKAPAPT